jgi:hypothetical protein
MRCAPAESAGARAPVLHIRALFMEKGERRSKHDDAATGCDEGPGAPPAHSPGE